MKKKDNSKPRKVKIINGVGEERMVEFPHWANYYLGGIFFRTIEDVEEWLGFPSHKPKA